MRYRTTGCVIHSTKIDQFFHGVVCIIQKYNLYDAHTILASSVVILKIFRLPTSPCWCAKGLSRLTYDYVGDAQEGILPAQQACRRQDHAFRPLELLYLDIGNVTMLQFLRLFFIFPPTFCLESITKNIYSELAIYVLGTYSHGTHIGHKDNIDANFSYFFLFVSLMLFPLF